MHLGASYLPDKKAAEARVTAFLRMIKPNATDLYILGDALDYWYEYRTAVPRGHIRFFGALAELADAGVRLHYFIGNHDIWLFDYLRDEIGMEIIDGYQVKEILGKRFFLTHGDGVGKLPAGFRLIRSMFRNRICQKLYASIHPRWTIPFAHRWSSSNRNFSSYRTPQFRGLDKEPQAIFAIDYLQNVDPSINYFVMGHLHTLTDERIGPDCRLIILGDWITQCTYATFDGTSMNLHKFEQ